MAHTPGPWKFSDECPYGRDIHSDDRIWLGSIHGSHANGDSRPQTGFPSPDEGEANARLIAAAPDLLEALEELNDLCPRMSDDDPIAPAIADAARKARAAIAKARDQS